MAILLYTSSTLLTLLGKESDLRMKKLPFYCPFLSFRIGACRDLRGEVDPISLEDLFYVARDGGAPGAQLYLYRLLGLLANGAPGDVCLTPFSCIGAREPSIRPGINNCAPPEKLFRNVGPAGLKLEACHDWLLSWFMDLATRELAKARRHGRHLSVLCVDLDDLGQVNLKFGRPAGDRVIDAAAAAISRSCRAEDILWHHGEDEFAVVLTDTGTDNAQMVARRLAAKLPSMAKKAGVDGQVSASIGISTYPYHGEDLLQLLAGARAALHLAKSKGKGEVQIAGKTSGAESGGKHRNMAGPDEQAPSAPVEFREPTGRYETQAMPDFGEADCWSAENNAASEEEAPGQRFAAAATENQNRGSICSIVIASASPLLLTGMRQMLAGVEDVRVIAEVADPGRLPLCVDDLRPDLLFADFCMAADNDLALVRLIESKNLSTKLAVSVAAIDQELIKLAAERWIDGIILQASSQKETLASLEKIFQGQKVLPKEVESALNEIDSKKRAINELSEREIEVLCLVAEGKSNSQIASELFITVNTVRFHLANVYQKLGVSNRTEAANYYHRQDLGCDDQGRLL